MEISQTKISNSIDSAEHSGKTTAGNRVSSEGLAGNYSVESRGDAHSLQYPGTRVVIDVT